MSCHVVLYCVLSCCITFCCVVPCCIELCRAVSCCIVLCFVVLYYILLCRVVLCCGTKGKSKRLTSLQMQNMPTCGFCLGTDSAAVLNTDSGTTSHHITSRPTTFETAHLVLSKTGPFPRANAEREK